MRHNYLTALLISFGIFLADPSFCEVIHGTVTYLDPVNKMFSVRDTAGAELPRQYVFTSADDLGDLKTGQTVVVEAQKGKGRHTLQADSITVSVTE